MVQFVNGMARMENVKFVFEKIEKKLLWFFVLFFFNKRFLDAVNDIISEKNSYISP